MLLIEAMLIKGWRTDQELGTVFLSSVFMPLFSHNAGWNVTQLDASSHYNLLLVCSSNAVNNSLVVPAASMRKMKGSLKCVPEFVAASCSTPRT